MLQIKLNLQMIDDYFLMRLPAQEAEHIHAVMRAEPKKMKKALQIEFDDDMKNAIVYVKRKPLQAHMVNLPTIVEASKTTNGINIYKTGTISQMLVVTDPETQTDGTVAKVKNNWPHGISVPLKNVRKQRFRKTMRNHEDIKEVADIQKEVGLLLRTDHEAISSRFEIYYEKPSAETEITEESLFGVMSGSESDESSVSVVSNYDIIEFN